MKQWKGIVIDNLCLVSVLCYCLVSVLCYFVLLMSYCIDCNRSWWLFTCCRSRLIRLNGLGLSFFFVVFSNSPEVLSFICLVKKELWSPFLSSIIALEIYPLASLWRLIRIWICLSDCFLCNTPDKLLLH